MIHGYAWIIHKKNLNSSQKHFAPTHNCIFKLNWGNQLPINQSITFLAQSLLEHFKIMNKFELVNG